MNKLYSWDLYDKSKIDSRRLATTIHEAWITSGYVIAENIDEAKEKIGMSFDLTNGKYVLNFDLGESFMNKYYIQDDKNSDVFIEEFLLEEDEKQQLEIRFLLREKEEKRYLVYCKLLQIVGIDYWS